MAGRLTALKAETRVVDPVLALVPALHLEARTAASEGSRSLSGAEVMVAQEEADELPMEAVVETYFEEVLEGAR